MSENNKIHRIGYIEKDTRWTATVVYRVNKKENRKVIHNVWELSELEKLIEDGPTFCAIDSFTIKYNGPKETIEESMK